MRVCVVLVQRPAGRHLECNFCQEIRTQVSTQWQQSRQAKPRVNWEKMNNKKQEANK